VHGEPKPGDRIIALGGRTGRDGIHGATFSSAELTDTHADEFSHAVQIGNAIDREASSTRSCRALRAAEEDLFNAITDCGAGGFSSAVGEMGEASARGAPRRAHRSSTTASTYTEIWISEAQERMVLAVPEDKVDALARSATRRAVELSTSARSAPSGKLVLNHGDRRSAASPMHFLHDGMPKRVREAVYTAPDVARAGEAAGLRHAETCSLLSRIFNIASKHWIMRQYDHEVQGGTVGKPLVGRHDDGPATRP
jgi:phosphoribosylformylglycinamidine (FGAM) synthase-like enzyme